MLLFRSLVVLAALIPRVAAADPLADELVRLEQERLEAYVEGDRETLERHFATEYVHTNLRGGLTDRTAELDFYAPDRFQLADGSISDVTANRYGNVAVLLATVSWEDAIYRPQPGTEIDLSGDFRVTRVYVRREGRWQLAASHASKIGPSEASN